MIEIIALIFLCRKNGDLAIQKGLKPGTWKIFTVLAWIIAEMIGVILGLVFFGDKNIIPTLLFALFCAFGGYLFIKYVLEKKPDHLDEEINGIGTDDLHPPRK